MVNIRAHANAPAKNERHVKKIRAHANAPAKKKERRTPRRENIARPQKKLRLAAARIRTRDARIGSSAINRLG
jgi:hypothetical protein